MSEPGALVQTQAPAPRGAGDACGPSHCITCADDGREMQVVRVDAARGLALCVDAQGSRHTVETALVEAVAPGHRLLVHAGTAIATLTEEAVA